MPVCKERIKGVTNTSTGSGKPLNLQIFTTTYLLHTASYSSHLVILNYYFHPLLPFYLQNRLPTSQGLGKTGVQLLQPIYPRAGTAFAVLSRQVMCTEMLLPLKTCKGSDPQHTYVQMQHARTLHGHGYVREGWLFLAACTDQIYCNAFMWFLITLNHIFQQVQTTVPFQKFAVKLILKSYKKKKRTPRYRRK